MYITVSVGSNRNRSKVTTGSAQPKFDYSVDDVVTSLGTVDAPTLLEIALWSMKNDKESELEGTIMFPIVDFADQKEHQFWLPLNGKDGKPSTWDLNLSITFGCDLKKLRTIKEIEDLFEKALATYPEEISIKKRAKHTTTQAKWEFVQKVSGKDKAEKASTPEGICKLLASRKFFKDNVNFLMEKFYGGKDNLLWRSTFITHNGIPWIFDFLKYLGDKIRYIS